MHRSRPLWPLPAHGLLLILTGCVASGDLDVLCDRSADLEARHAEALAASPDHGAVMTGQPYLATLAAACGRI